MILQQREQTGHVLSQEQMSVYILHVIKEAECISQYVNIDGSTQVVWESGVSGYVEAGYTSGIVVVT